QARCIPGTGLGLSIVKQLVDTMGGEVSMQSKVDSGTTVAVSIPVQSQDIPLNGETAPQPTPEAISEDGHAPEE
ncbi:MAG TPA: ATP-binding protein, partial [Chloroflexota bacterium]|nr:ATP-binding protein [Chloroflexota bacterium]